MAPPPPLQVLLASQAGELPPMARHVLLYNGEYIEFLPVAPQGLRGPASSSGAPPDLARLQPLLWFRYRGAGRTVEAEGGGRTVRYSFCVAVVEVRGGREDISRYRGAGRTVEAQEWGGAGCGGRGGGLGGI